MAVDVLLVFKMPVCKGMYKEGCVGHTSAINLCNKNETIFFVITLIVCMSTVVKQAIVDVYLKQNVFNTEVHISKAHLIGRYNR